MHLPYKKLFFSFLGILLILGILAGLEYVLSSYPLRLDLTSNRIYSLSNSTKTLVGNLEDPVTITAYFSSAFPPESKENLTKLYVENTLKELQRYGGKNLIVRFVDPKTDQEKKTEAERAGIVPLQLNTIKNDSYSVEVGYLGLTISYEDKKEVIPYFSNALSPEYEVSTRIRKITSKNLPSIGIISDLGAPSLHMDQKGGTSMELLSKEVSSSYKLLPIALKETKEFSKEVASLLITGLTEDIPEDKISLLESFVERGNNIILAQNFQNLSLEKGIESKPLSLPHLDGFLKKHGIQIQQGYIADVPSKQIPVTSQQGMIMMRQIIEFPLMPVITKVPDTILTKGVRALSIPFASALLSTNKELTPLLSTSSSAQTFPSNGPINPLDPKSFFPSGSGSTMSYALMGMLAPEENKKHIFAIGSSSCLSDQIIQSTQDRSCLDLVLNAIDWSIQDKNLMEVRNKVSEDRPLAHTTTEEKMIYKVLALGLPGLLVLLLGISRLILRNKRMKRTYKS